MTRFLAVPALVALCGTASAQPGATRPAEALDEKSPGIALGFSLAGTAAGVAAILASSQMEDGGGYLAVAGIGALVVGPSLGHFYAGEPGRATGHAAIRLGSLAVMGTGLLVVFSSPCAFSSDDRAGCDDREDAGIGIFLAGATFGAVSTVYSIIDAPRAAGRTNRKSASATTLMPAPIVGPGRSTGFGVALTSPF